MVVNGSGRLQGGKDHADQPDKKQSRPDKRNTVDRIDLNYTAGVLTLQFYLVTNKMCFATLLNDVPELIFTAIYNPTHLEVSLIGVLQLL